MIWQAPIDPNYPKGRLSGSVFCSSTGAPLPSAAIKIQGADQEARNHSFGVQFLGKTDANGKFDFPSVLVGTYYIFATLPGYVSPESLLPRMLVLGPPVAIIASQEIMNAALSQISVTQHHTSEIDLQLQPGGSISGRVTWNDGTPARHNEISLMLVEGDKRRPHTTSRPEDHPMGEEDRDFTDSDGRFRINDLFTGSYIVGHRVPRLLNYHRKNLVPERGPAILNCASVYLWTGDKPYFEEATPIEVHCGDHIVGLDTELPMLEPRSSSSAWPVQ